MISSDAACARSLYFLNIFFPPTMTFPRANVPQDTRGSRGFPANIRIAYVHIAGTIVWNNIIGSICLSTRKSSGDRVIYSVIFRLRVTHARFGASRFRIGHRISLVAGNAIMHFRCRNAITFPTRRANDVPLDLRFGKSTGN